MPLAEGGDPLAQYSLGKLYETGGGGTPDYEAAARWYALAAQQDMAAAQNNLGLMYAQGRGVPRDPARAAQLWSRSANASNPMAQYNLGLAYFRGEGVGQDQVEAAVWFHLAADAGVGEAQFALGQMHRLGLALPQDDRRALHWYERAAKRGHKDAGEQAKRLQSQGIRAAQPLDVVPPDPMEQTGSKAAAAATDSPGGAVGSGDDDRKPSLVQDSRPVAQVTEAPDTEAPVANTPVTNMPVTNTPVTNTPAKDGGQGGYQLQSRLITPVPQTKNTDRAPTPQAATESATAVPAAEGSKAEEGAQVARNTAPRSEAVRQTEQETGTFLWLLSSVDEAQARDLLKEAEQDYAVALTGQKLSLLRDPNSSARSFYRLVVAAESQAQAAATCEKIRQINAEAFCSILVR